MSTYGFDDSVPTDYTSQGSWNAQIWTQASCPTGSNMYATLNGNGGDDSCECSSDPVGGRTSFTLMMPHRPHP